MTPAYSHTKMFHEGNSTWQRGGKVYAVLYRLHKWDHKDSPMFTKDQVMTMETVYGRISVLDRNKYLPNGSANPRWYKNEV